MALYCIPAEYVVNSVSRIENIYIEYYHFTLLLQMKSVGDSLYNSQWYHKTSLENKKKITLVLIQAQKNIDFSACGLVSINLHTFVLVSIYVTIIF